MQSLELSLPPEGQAASHLGKLIPYLTAYALIHWSWNEALGME